jgi:hypothetical protein
LKIIVPERGFNRRSARPRGLLAFGLSGCDRPLLPTARPPCAAEHHARSRRAAGLGSGGRRLRSARGSGPAVLRWAAGTVPGGRIRRWGDGSAPDVPTHPSGGTAPGAPIRQWAGARGSDVRTHRPAESGSRHGSCSGVPAGPIPRSVAGSGQRLAPRDSAGERGPLPPCPCRWQADGSRPVGCPRRPSDERRQVRPGHRGVDSAGSRAAPAEREAVAGARVGSWLRPRAPSSRWAAGSVGSWALRARHRREREACSPREASPVRATARRWAGPALRVGRNPAPPIEWEFASRPVRAPAWHRGSVPRKAPRSRTRRPVFGGA